MIDKVYTFTSNHQIPMDHWMIKAIDNWQYNGRISEGSLLWYMVTNDLSRCVFGLDEESLPYLKAALGYLYNQAPAQCHGSVKKVEEYRERLSLIRIQIEKLWKTDGRVSFFWKLYSDLSNPIEVGEGMLYRGESWGSKIQDLADKFGLDVHKRYPPTPNPKHFPEGTVGAFDVIMVPRIPEYQVGHQQYGLQIHWGV